MRLRSGVLALSLLSATTGLWAVGPLPGAGSPANFNLEKRTQIPGNVLKPGAYTIHVVDHLQDRIVVEVDGNNGKDHQLFLAVPAQTGTTGPVAWDKGPAGNAALRGFNFPNGMAVEFVYPKATAVALARANGAPVIAVDPDSEGKPEIDKMSADDRRIVSLWLLSITRTGTDDKTQAVLAKHYQAPDVQQQGIEARIAPTPATVAPSNQVASLTRPVPLPTPSRVAPYRAPRQKPVVSVLPHTASNLPLVALIGSGALFAGCMLMMRRRFSL